MLTVVFSPKTNLSICPERLVQTGVKLLNGPGNM